MAKNRSGAPKKPKKSGGSKKHRGRKKGFKPSKATKDRIRRSVNAYYKTGKTKAQRSGKAHKPGKHHPGAKKHREGGSKPKKSKKPGKKNRSGGKKAKAKKPSKKSKKSRKPGKKHHGPAMTAHQKSVHRHNKKLAKSKVHLRHQAGLASMGKAADSDYLRALRAKLAAHKAARSTPGSQHYVEYGAF